MLSREEYKIIKSFNREKMSQYLANLQNNAFNEGVSAFSKQIAERVDAGIRNTQGIGEKRYTELIANINIELNKWSDIKKWYTLNYRYF